MLDDFEKFLDQLSPGPISRKTPMILYRKGGDKSDWVVCGSNVYVPVATIVQIGAMEWSGAAASTGTVSQAFQAKYYGEPLIFVQVLVTAPAGAYVMTKVTSSGDAVDIAWKSDINVTVVRFSYIAYGGQLRSG